MSEKKPRRRYSDEFKAEAVRQIHQSGRTAASVARELGINANMLYNWKAEIERQMPQEDLALTEEVERLRKENAKLKREKEILEKATAIFAEYRR